MTATDQFPLNAWYAAAWDNDVQDQPVARTICGKSVVLYRQQDDTAVALEDVCLHRLLPLSMGRVEGDRLVCGYHGMAFDGHGKCVRMPTPSEAPAPGAKVGNYPVVERHRFIWIWMGEAALADPALVPDLYWMNDPAWAAGGSVFEMDCDYRLVLDNLMDLTHETFVHASSIGHQQITEVPFEVTRDGGEVTLSRWMIDTQGPPFMAMQLRLAKDLSAEHVDRWQIIRFKAPATIVIDVGLAATGTGAAQGDFSQGFNGRVINTVTPRGDGKCYYFFAYARDFALQDDEFTTNIVAANIKIFAEDKIVLEAQQKSIDALSDRKLLNLNIDRGSFYVRRAINEMIRSEKADAPADMEVT